MTRAREILNSCEGLGVELWIDGENLGYRAPANVLTGQRLDLLREHKQEILHLLREEDSLDTIEPDPAARFEPFPLTDIQAAYLVGRSPGVPYGGLGCHGYGELHLSGFDHRRLQSAWDALLARHDSLRLVFDRNGMQRVLPEPAGFTISVTHAGDRQAVRQRMAHRVYDPRLWPLFDLSVTGTDGDWVLHLSIDFLIADFVSLQVLLAELEAEYRLPGALGPAPAVSFRDCVLARRRLSASRRRARDEAYWNDRLAALPPGPQLPVGAVDQVQPSFSRLTKHLPGRRWADMKRRAAGAGLTANAAVLAAYAAVVSRWNDQPQFTLSVTVLSRPDGHPDVPCVVGDFTTVELLVVDARSAPRFRDRARAIQSTLADDLGHSTFTGIDVIRELRRRDAHASAMFPVVFTSSLGLRRGAGGEALMRLGYGISQTPQVWLDCQVMEADDGLNINWDYRDGVVEPAVIEAMFDAFDRFLDDLANGDTAWEAEDPVAVPAAQLARRPSAPVDGAPHNTRLHEAFLRMATSAPHRTAVVTPSGSYTYGQLLTLSNAVSAALIGTGCEPGSLVAIEMDKGWEQLPAVIGTLLAGCAYVPVDTTQPAARRQRILRDTGSSYVLTQSWLGVQGIHVDKLTPVSNASGRRSGETAYVMYTSGTSGDPKGVVIAHDAVVNTIRDVNERFAVTRDSSVLGLASLGFDLSVFDIFGPLSAGGRLVLPSAAHRNDPQHWADLISACTVTHWNSVPAQLEMLLSYLDSEPGMVFDSLRYVLLSGDWVAPSLQPRIAARAPQARTFSLGGATEASIWSIMHPMEVLDPAASTVPYGRPLRNQSVLVLDDQLREVPDLVAGELYIGGVGLATRYHGDELLTAQRFTIHPPTGQRLYRTGDLGRYLPDGNIEFLGRRDSQVKIRGHRVELGEIEAVLQAHSAISSATVVSGEAGGSRQLTAFVVPTAAPQPQPGHAAAGLGEQALAQARTLRESIDTDAMLRFARELDATGLLQMLHTLCAAGLFATSADEHDLADILDRARVAPRHQRLVRRWITALERNGLLRQDSRTGRFSRLAAADKSLVEAAWERVGTYMEGVERRTELVDYFRTTAACLPQLIRGEVDPLEQLFPAGRTDIHEVAYNGIFLSHYLNRILVGIATSLAGSPLAPLRVLEIGAGVGGTSVELIPALAAFGVEYTFTDVSRFFLNNAKERFPAHPFIDYRLFDINGDIWSQGLRPNSYSLIVCANVLHYARNVDAALARIKQLLRPGGWLLFIEATHDNYQVMTSMEFLFDEKSGDFTDVRRPLEQTFVSVAQWNDALRNAGSDSFCHLPADDPITSQMGMHVFAAQFKSTQSHIDRLELQDYLVRQLPDHMLPAQLFVLDGIPLTGNGKADRKLLSSLATATGAAEQPTGLMEPAVGELEEMVAGIFAAKLGRPVIGRNQPFYDLGGDSLVAAQIAAQIRTSIPGATRLTFDRVLRVIFDNATVARLATELTAAGDMATDPAGRDVGELVTLAEGAGTPTVLVHDASGNLDSYDLSTVDGPVLGLRVRDTTRYCQIDVAMLVERLAEEYTSLLTDAGYLRLRVAGRHFGGLVAVELARQLTEAGVTVDALTIVDGHESEQPQTPVFAHSVTSARDWTLLPYVGDLTVVSTAPGPARVHWQDVCLGELTIETPGS